MIQRVRRASPARLAVQLLLGAVLLLVLWRLRDVALISFAAIIAAALLRGLAHPVVRYTRRKATAISIWANRLLERKAARLVTVAVANKMARIAWAVMARDESYRATSVAA